MSTTNIKSILLIFFLILTSCVKDDVNVIEKITTESKTVADSVINLEGIDLTIVKDFSRSGITNAPLFHVPTFSVSHTLLGVFKHEWFTRNGLDSIRMIKTSSGTAILNGVTIANYNITLFYRGGITILLQGHLSKYVGENVKLLPTAITTPLMNLSTTQRRVIAERTNVSPKSVKHIYKPQSNTTVYPWRFSIDGVFSHQEYMLPANQNTNTWSPNHVI